MKAIAARVAVGFLVVVVLVAAYGVLVEPRLILDEVRLEARLDGLSDAWAGEEVVLFSDLQVGMRFANLGMVERVVERTVALEPAAVLIAGDFLYSVDPGIPAQIDRTLDLLGPLLATDVPVYAVLGNHDYAVDAADQLTAVLEEHDVEVLRNGWATVPHPGGAESNLNLVGLGPERPGRTDAEQALDGLPADAPRLVLMHNPTSFPHLPAGAAPLALAGHTHCGQVALPGTPHWSYIALAQEEEIVADGFAPAPYGEDGNRLYVNCGIGFSRLPIRINAPPQLVRVELVPR